MKTIIYPSVKGFILALFLLLSTSAAYSQIRFGIRGGFDVIDHKVNAKILDSSNRAGFQIGGVLEVMSPVLGLGGELSVLYGLQEYKIRNEGYDLSNYHYLHVPLNLKKSFSILPKVGVFVSAGPYANFRLDGGDMQTTVEGQYKAKSYGVGVNAGAGVKLFGNCELGMYFRKQLTDNYSEKPITGSQIAQGLTDRPDYWSVKFTFFL